MRPVLKKGRTLRGSHVPLFWASKCAAPHSWEPTVALLHSLRCGSSARNELTSLRGIEVLLPYVPVAPARERGRASTLRGVKRVATTAGRRRSQVFA